MESEQILTQREKIPSTRDPEEGRTCNAASCWTASPTHNWLSCCGPRVSDLKTDLSLICTDCTTQDTASHVVGPCTLYLLEAGKDALKFW